MFEAENDTQSVNNYKSTITKLNGAFDMTEYYSNCCERYKWKKKQDLSGKDIITELLCCLSVDQLQHELSLLEETMKE